MSDWRRVESGMGIPSENYCDQPYIVVTNEGNWLCVLTTGVGEESKPNQHVVATISEDKGRSWSELIDIEPAGERMTSWVTSFVVPNGRVFAVFNVELSEESTQHGGALCYRYSDDGGRSWSSHRYRIPIRQTKKDRENVTEGREQFFWCIDKPIVTESGVYFGIPKLHSGRGTLHGESWVLHSANILTESDPNGIRWELLPDGDDGIWGPELGDIQEEQNLEMLSDGSLYMVMRTETGVIGYTVSRDRGHTWTTPEPLRYPDGRALRNPRACPKLGKTGDGRLMLWFHNNGYPGWGNSAVRNPVWISGGIEIDGTIEWSQPEILLYASDPTVRGMSYPDFLEQDERIWVSETEKLVVRVHEVDRTLLEGMWSERVPNARSTVARDGLLTEWDGMTSAPGVVRIPRLPSLQTGGFTVELLIEPDGVHPGQTVVSSYGVKNRGFRIATSEAGALELEIADNRQRRWVEVMDGPDPGSSVVARTAWCCKTDAGIVREGESLHVAFVVDGFAKVVTVVANGLLLDGADERIQGWWRLNPWIDDINDEHTCEIGKDFRGRVTLFRLYDRYLRTAEVIANYRAGTHRKGGPTGSNGR